MNAEELKLRIKQYAYRCVIVAEALPDSKRTSKIISYQLIRSAFSGANNYRAATRAQSKPHFLSRLSIALEEVDESLDWLESIADLELIGNDKIAALMDEARQIVRILGASKNTLQIQLGKKLPKDSHSKNIDEEIFDGSPNA